MTNKIEWEEKFSVDVPELDAFQKELLERFNTLIDIDHLGFAAVGMGKTLQTLHDVAHPPDPLLRIDD